MTVSKDAVYRAYVLSHQANNSVSEAMVEFAFDRMKGLEKDLAGRRFTFMLPKQRRDKNGNIIAGRNFLAYCDGVRPRDSQGLKLLYRMKEQYYPSQTWDACNFQGKKCRVITNIDNMFELCRLGLFQGTERRYVDTLAPVNWRNMQEKEREMRRAVEQIAVPEETKLKVSYLLDRKLSLYAEAAEENNEAVLKAILHAKDPVAQLQTWDRIRMMPKPFPFLSKKEGSLGTRLYHLPLSMLCSEARSAWLPFAISMDIK